MHLCSDPIDDCFTISLPFFDPLDQALQLLVVVPVRFQIVVVNEQLCLLARVCVPASLLCGHSYHPGNPASRSCSWHRLPIHFLLTGGRRGRRRYHLHGEGFVYHIPGKYIAICSCHHTFNPSVHGPGEGVSLLFGSEWNLVARFLDFPHNVIEIIGVGFLEFRKVESNVSSLPVCPEWNLRFYIPSIRL